jgi:N-methylhydantoinase B
LTTSLEARPKLDPVTFEVLRHKLWQVADEMGTTLVRVSGSPIVTEVLDFATVLFDARGTWRQWDATVCSTLALCRAR